MVVVKDFSHILNELDIVMNVIELSKQSNSQLYVCIHSKVDLSVKLVL